MHATKLLLRFNSHLGHAGYEEMHSVVYAALLSQPRNPDFKIGETPFCIKGRSVLEGGNSDPQWDERLLQQTPVTFALVLGPAIIVLMFFFKKIKKKKKRAKADAVWISGARTEPSEQDRPADTHHRGSPEVFTLPAPPAPLPAYTASQIRPAALPLAAASDGDAGGATASAFAPEEENQMSYSEKKSKARDTVTRPDSACCDFVK